MRREEIAERERGFNMEFPVSHVKKGQVKKVKVHLLLRKF